MVRLPPSSLFPETDEEIISLIRSENRVNNEYKKIKVYGSRTYKLRKAILVLLGDKCVRCGFSDDRALQIDHIFGNGTRERKRYGSNNIYPLILKKIVNGSTDYQVLCANCNWIKRHEKEEQSRHNRRIQ